MVWVGAPRAWRGSAVGGGGTHTRCGGLRLPPPSHVHSPHMHCYEAAAQLYRRTAPVPRLVDVGVRLELVPLGRPAGQLHPQAGIGLVLDLRHGWRGRRGQAQGDGVVG